MVMSHLCTGVSDHQGENAGHFAVVGEFEAGLGSWPNQGFDENKPVLLFNINVFRIAELFSGELAAFVAHMMFFKDGGNV